MVNSHSYQLCRNGIITHHQVNKDWLKLDYISQTYTSFPWSYFSLITKRSLVHTDLEKCYIIDNYGQKHPIFYLVPCGKCALCRQKKSMDWQCRIEAETACHTVKPLLVTLTYAYEPKNGLEKVHLQEFWHDLRQYLDRRNIYHKLRYFQVGEYGSKKGRAHYHLLIWNWQPSWFSMLKIKRIMRRAWRNRGHVFIGIAGEPFNNGYKTQSGNTSGLARYLAKYMRKKQHVPKGKNDVFFTASNRGGGIGSSYLEKYIQLYRDNLHYTDVQIKNPFCGVISKFTLPSLWRQKITPSLSRIVPKYIRDAWTRFTNLVNTRCQLISKYTQRDVIPIIAYKNLFIKFNYLPYAINTPSVVYPYKLKNSTDTEKLKWLDAEIQNYIDILEDFDLSPKDVNYLLDLKEQYQRYLESLPQKLYEVDALLTQAEKRELQILLTENPNL